MTLFHIEEPPTESELWILDYTTPMEIHCLGLQTLP